MKYISWIIITVLCAAIIGTMVWYSSRPGQYETFATCIAESGAKFYGAFWCPHCQAQKALFGRSAKKLPYVECSTTDGQGQLPICKEKAVESYPTWIFKDGTKQTGEVSLVDLSKFTGCPLAKDN
jgi:thiol-disulfide isomerase/thioredoxin